MSKKIILLDGNSLAYRAFYALPDTMKTASGVTTNALYGFTTMLLKILDKKPDLMAVAFDRAAPTFRHKEYKEYKATRQKAPPTLYEQLPNVRRIVQAFNIPMFEMDGFEADDLIGTLAKMAEKEGYDVEIFTGDMDALQLVDDKITVQRTVKGITDIVAFDEKEVESKYGITPKQVIDYKAILGDTSDNIPGIHGIGKVGAVNLLKEFGTLENVLNNIDKIKGAGLKKKVEEGIESAKLSKMLATIVTDVPLKYDFTTPHPVDINWEKIMPLLEEFEFTSLIKKYGRKDEAATLFSIDQKRTEIKESKCEYVTVTTKEQLAQLIGTIKAAKAFTYDTETTGTSPFEVELVGISIAMLPSHAYYIPVGHNEGKQLDKKYVIDQLKPIFEDKKIMKSGQNIKFDNEILYNCGIKVQGTAFDTMIAAYTLDPTSKIGLKAMAHGLLGKKMIEITELIGTGAKQITMAEVAIDVASDYACSDADLTLQLVALLKEKIAKEKLEDLLYKIEVPLVEVLESMEENGVSIDTDLLKIMSKELEAEMKHLETQIFAIAGEVFNINSPKQLQNILFNKLMLPITKRTKTGASTDVEVLEEMAEKYEIARHLMDFRTLQKLKGTYIDSLPLLINKKDGRIHTSFNQTVTATGRLSSTNPNMQNIPAKGPMAKRIRQAFVPALKGWSILAADYSQIELRVLAHLSGDKVFAHAFNNDLDIHKITASEVFGVLEDKVTQEMRDQAKVVNFGIIYGMSDFGLSKSLKIKRTDAAKYIDTYFIKHSGVKKFIDEVIAQARKDGFVTTLLGRRRPIPDINSPNNNLRMFAERVATNTPVQGTAADIIKVAMINVQNLLDSKGLKAKMILQVHDELVLEVPDNELKEVEQMLKHEMENAVKLNVPVKVHIGSGKNWAEAKS